MKLNSCYYYKGKPQRNDMSRVYVHEYVRVHVHMYVHVYVPV